MSSVYVVKRPTKKGDRFHVRWEEGRKSKAIHLGSYATEKLAKKRADAARQQLANGEVPTLRIVDQERDGRKIREVAAVWIKRREMDSKPATLRSFRHSISKINEQWGSRDPASITVDEIQEWMTTLGYKPSTTRLVLTHLGQILEFADVDPNPLRSSKLVKPKVPRKKTRLPLRSELAAMYAKLAEKNRAAVAMLEHGGLRNSEMISLVWADVHQSRGYLVVRDTKTDAGERIVKQIDGLPVLPDRPSGVSDTARVFQNVTEDSIAAAMRRACRNAGVPPVNPHLLRKLHISRLMHNMKLDPATIAARAGHASPKITLDVYSLMIPEE